VTRCGKETDFDPDALVQCMIVGMLGYHTPDGIGSEDNPDDFKPSPLVALFEEGPEDSKEAMIRAVNLTAKLAAEEVGKVLRQQRFGIVSTLGATTAAFEEDTILLPRIVTDGVIDRQDDGTVIIKVEGAEWHVPKDQMDSLREIVRADDPTVVRITISSTDPDPSATVEHLMDEWRKANPDKKADFQVGVQVNVEGRRDVNLPNPPVSLSINIPRDVADPYKYVLADIEAFKEAGGFDQHFGKLGFGTNIDTPPRKLESWQERLVGAEIESDAPVVVEPQPVNTETPHHEPAPKASNEITEVHRSVDGWSATTADQQVFVFPYSSLESAPSVGDFVNLADNELGFALLRP
jgi:hypothetical protein